MGYFCAMFKKIAVYGLAFGSLSASMVLIQFINGLYRERTIVTAIPVLANIVFPALGVFMFIKAISRLQTDKPINLGGALFGSLLVSTVIALCNIAAYHHVMFNRTDIIKDYKGRNYNSIEVYYKADTALTATVRTEKIQEAKNNFDKNIGTGTWARTQFMLCLSTGLVVSLLTFISVTRKYS